MPWGNQSGKILECIFIFDASQKNVYQYTSSSVLFYLGLLENMFFFSFNSKQIHKCANFELELKYKSWNKSSWKCASRKIFQPIVAPQETLFFRGWGMMEGQKSSKRHRTEAVAKRNVKFFFFASFQFSHPISILKLPWF